MQIKCSVASSAYAHVFRPRTTNGILRLVGVARRSLPLDTNMWLSPSRSASFKLLGDDIHCAAGTAGCWSRFVWICALACGMIGLVFGCKAMLFHADLGMRCGTTIPEEQDNLTCRPLDSRSGSAIGQTAILCLRPNPDPRLLLPGHSPSAEPRGRVGDGVYVSSVSMRAPPVSSRLLM